MNDESDVIRKVADLDQVGVFECHGPAVYDRPFGDTRVAVTNPVPVVGVDGSRIGFATVDVDSSNLDTKIFITRECPERLDLENGEPYFLNIADSAYIEDKVTKELEIYVVQLLSAKGGHNLPLVVKGAF